MNGSMAFVQSIAIAHIHNLFPFIHDPISRRSLAFSNIYTHTKHTYTHSVRIHFFCVCSFSLKFNAICFIFPHFTLNSLLPFSAAGSRISYIQIDSFILECMLLGCVSLSILPSFRFFTHLSLSQPYIYINDSRCVVCAFFFGRASLPLFLCGYYFVVIEAHIFLYR